MTHHIDSLGPIHADAWHLDPAITRPNHGYNACNNVARYVAQRSGATAVTAEIPVPTESP